MNTNSRLHNSIRNVLFGLLITVINTIVSFVTRTAIIKILGAEILGVNGLFTEVISMLSLVELGVGMAIIYSLYKPIRENDVKKISQLMGLYRSAYNIVAIVTLVLGMILMPFIDLLITDIEYPISFIRIVFTLFIIRTSSSYLFSYKASIIYADQKQYIASIITVVVKVIVTIAIVVCLIIFKSFVLYLILLILQSLITNIVISKYVDKKYPYIDYKEKLDIQERKSVFSNIKNIFIKRVSGVITSSTDNLLISKLVSTIQVGYYSNYVMIYTVIRTLKQQLTNGIAASIGDLSVTSEPEHCKMVLKKLTYLYYLFAMIVASGLMAVSKSFITLWIGQDYVMNDIVVYITIFNLFLEICCDPLWQFLEVSGLFKQDKYIGLFGSLINLIVSVVLGIKIGLIGIFLGTVTTQVIQLILKTRLIFKEKYNMSPWIYYLFWLRMILGYFILAVIQYFVIRVIPFDNTLIEFILKGLISVLIAAVIAVAFFMKSDSFKYTIELIRSFQNRIFHGKRRL